MGFSSYFLIVWDFVRYAKENGIAVGPGRGSAAGSIVAYSLNITDVDPLAHGLMFERFLNPARKSMPDIDIDFSVRGRERVMRYVAGEVRARVGRPDHHLRHDGPAGRHPRRGAGARIRLRAGDRLAKQIPEPIMGRSPSFEECLKPGEELKAHLRLRPRRAADRRHRPGPRGHRPQQLDPRRRGRDRRPAAAGDRPAAARRGPRRRQRNGNGNGKAERAVQDRHPVLDGADRGDRPAEDGLPRAAQPRRDRGRGGDHRALPRREDRHRGRSRSTTPRPTRCSPRATRSASSSSSPTACATRCERSGRRVPGHRRPRRALPARSDALHPGLRKGKRDPSSVRFPDERLRPITESTYGCVIYQEQLMEIAKQMAGFARPRRTTCARRSARRSAT